MDAQVEELRLTLDEPGVEPAELAEQTLLLRSELLRLDVEDVEPAPGPVPPPGSRGVETVEAGVLLVTLLRSPELLTALVNAVGSWLGARPERRVTLRLGNDSLEVTGASRREQRRLADEWLRRQGAGGHA